MLTDTALKNLRPKEKLYKKVDRDGLYVAVASTGAISFRYDYSLNQRRETVTLGKYGVGGITLAEARLLLNDAKKLVNSGQSPAHEKARGKEKRRQDLNFSGWCESWLLGCEMADSTRDMRRSVYRRDVEAPFGNRRLEEITHEDLRQLADSIVARGAPATAVHVREIVSQVFRWAVLKTGNKIENPADLVKPSSIAVFESRDRSLDPEEIATMYKYLERVGTTPSIRVAVKLLLLTMVRKSELTEATWAEISFTDAVWTIPKERMKRRNAHTIYLSTQVLDMLVALKTFAGGSRYVFPGRYDPDMPMSKATLNTVTKLCFVGAQADGARLDKFGPHDLRRTGSTLLHEAGYNSDWIEKCLAHEQKGVRGVYNKAEYREPRIAMMQDWADMIDGWVAKPK